MRLTTNSSCTSSSINPSLPQRVGNVADIQAIYILPSYRGKGVSDCFLRWVVTTFHDSIKILYVLDTNAYAIGLYTRCLWVAVEGVLPVEFSAFNPGNDQPYICYQYP